MCLNIFKNKYPITRNRLIITWSDDIRDNISEETNRRAINIFIL